MSFGRRDFLRLTAYSVGAFAVLGTANIARAETPVRPPGAIAESDFLSLCLRCGRCIDACPEHVLRRATLTEGGLAGLNTPVLTQGCTLCLDCTKECPVEALLPIAESEARMGRIVVDSELCVGCWLCVRECPHEALVRNNETRVVEVDLNKCVGCGICIPVCPAEENALSLSPEGAHRPRLRG